MCENLQTGRYKIFAFRKTHTLCVCTICTLCILGDENCGAISATAILPGQCATACRFNCRSLSRNCPKFHPSRPRPPPMRILTLSLEGAYRPCNYISAVETAIWVCITYYIGASWTWRPYFSPVDIQHQLWLVLQKTSEIRKHVLKSFFPFQSA